MILSINAWGRLCAYDGQRYRPLQVTNLVELQAELDRLGIIMVSSSIDHPEEYTTDANVIALCRELRSQGADD